MVTKLTAQEAIEKVKNEKTTFLGMAVNKNNYAWDVRQALQVMAETGELSPNEFNKAMKVTFADMTDREKEIDEFQAVSSKGGKRDGAGRPTGSTSRKATRNIVKQIRWTEEEWEKIESKAGADNLKPSEWIRKQCL